MQMICSVVLVRCQLVLYLFLLVLGVLAECSWPAIPNLFNTPQPTIPAGDLRCVCGPQTEGSGGDRLAMQRSTDG